MRNVEVVEHSREDATEHNMRIKMRKDMNHPREGLKGEEIGDRGSLLLSSGHKLF